MGTAELLFLAQMQAASASASAYRLGSMPDDPSCDSKPPRLVAVLRLTRAPNPYVYDGRGWQRIDFEAAVLA